MQQRETAEDGHTLTASVSQIDRRPSVVKRRA
jgi:hypothetical protein